MAGARRARYGGTHDRGGGCEGGRRSGTHVASWPGASGCHLPAGWRPRPGVRCGGPCAAPRVLRLCGRRRPSPWEVSGRPGVEPWCVPGRVPSEGRGRLGVACECRQRDLRGGPGSGGAGRFPSAAALGAAQRGRCRQERRPLAAEHGGPGGDRLPGEGPPPGGGGQERCPWGCGLPWRRSAGPHGGGVGTEENRRVGARQRAHGSPGSGGGGLCRGLGGAQHSSQRRRGAPSCGDHPATVRWSGDRGGRSRPCSLDAGFGGGNR